MGPGQKPRRPVFSQRGSSIILTLVGTVVLGGGPGFLSRAFQIYKEGFKFMKRVQTDLVGFEMLVVPNFS